MFNEAVVVDVIRCIHEAEISRAISEFEALTALGIVHLGLRSSFAADYFELARLVARTDEEKTLITEAEGIDGTDIGAVIKALDKYLQMFMAKSPSSYN